MGPVVGAGKMEAFIVRMMLDELLDKLANVKVSTDDDVQWPSCLREKREMKVAATEIKDSEQGFVELARSNGPAAVAAKEEEDKPSGTACKGSTTTAVVEDDDEQDDEEKLECTICTTTTGLESSNCSYSTATGSSTAVSAASATASVANAAEGERRKEDASLPYEQAMEEDDFEVPLTAIACQEQSEQQRQSAVTPSSKSTTQLCDLGAGDSVGIRAAATSEPQKQQARRQKQQQPRERKRKYPVAPEISARARAEDEEAEAQRTRRQTGTTFGIDPLRPLIVARGPIRTGLSKKVLRKLAPLHPHAMFIKEEKPEAVSSNEGSDEDYTEE